VIRAHYELEAREPKRAAAAIAGELSSGTFTAVPGETDELRARHAAAVVACEAVAGGLTRVAIDVPIDNVGASLPQLVATLAGNVFELRDVATLRLVDFDLPAELERAFPGPAFGVAGSRTASAVLDRPLVGTIVKPSVGLSPEATAALVATLGAAGVDLVKDDELIGDPPYSPLAERIARVRAALREVEDASGRRVTYVPNVSGGVEHMLRGAELAAAEGARAAMVCVHAVGLAGVLELRRAAILPLHGHRAGWGLLGRGSTSLGPAAHARIWRLAGIDQLHVGGLRSKFFELDASVSASMAACLAPGQHRPTLPVISSGQWGEQLLDTVAAAGGIDFAYLAGGAILGHPNGPAAGVRALRAAAEGAVAGVGVRELAASVPELAATVAAFGDAP
jgi:3-oxoisoapionate-4-phosphate transcarboxylase/hydrolase